MKYINIIKFSENVLSYFFSVSVNVMQLLFYGELINQE